MVLSRLPQSSCGKCPFSCALRPLRLTTESTNQKESRIEKFVDAAGVLSYLWSEGVVSIKIYVTHTHIKPKNVFIFKSEQSEAEFELFC